MKVINWLARAHWEPTGRALAALLAVFLLAGCALAPSGPGTPSATVQRLRQQAEQARMQGDLAHSASLLKQAAAVARSPQREELLLRAARLYLDLDQPLPAREVLAQTRNTALPPVDDALRRIIIARLALREGHSSDALKALGQRPSDLPDEILAAWLDVEADADLAEGQPLAAARARDRRSQLLPEQAARQANRKALWSALLAIPMEQLMGLIPPVPDRFGGWLELAYFYRIRLLDPQALTTALNAWQLRYPNHPANGAFAESLLSAARQAPRPPRKIALLLPLSGSLAGPGSAVENGFLAAYYQDPPQQRPELQVYDVGADGKDSLSAYRDAVAAGANLVVGPLTKSALQQLTVLQSASTPILGLNTLPGSNSAIPGLYQFGLAPEDDARAAADLAWRRGYRTAVAIVPNSDWGERVGAAFQEQFQSLGGRVLKFARYRPQDSDFSDAIEAALNLDSSIQRYHRLRALLQREIQFQPRRRHDIDCIFIGAFPREARLIQPQIRFHRALGVPVIATSQAYAGIPNPAADRDMDGLLLMDIPWIMQSGNAATGDALSRNRLARLWPQNLQRYPRLYALGMDAYRLAPLLALLHSDRGLQIEGRTGRLTMDRDGIIHRGLQPAQFKDGFLQPLDTGPNPVAASDQHSP